jgi:tetratricopeptide (TPR) repeat protein
VAPVKDADTADGDVVVPIDVKTFGFWLKAAFGLPTTTGSGPCSHELRSGNWSLPNLVIETGCRRRGAMQILRLRSRPCLAGRQMQWSGLLTALGWWRRRDRGHDLARRPAHGAGARHSSRAELEEPCYCLDRNRPQESPLFLRPVDRAARLSLEAAEREAAGDAAAAEAGWRQALALREEAGAGREQSQRSDQHALAALLVRLDRPEEAEPLARAACDGPEAETVEEQSGRLAALVDVLCATGRAAEAEPLARALLAAQAADPETRGTESHARALTYLASVLSEQKRTEEAEEFLRQAIEVLEVRVGPDHPARAGLILWIGNLHQSRDDLPGAEALCREALDIQVRSLGADDLAVAETLSCLGQLLDRAGRPEEAVRNLRQSLSILTGKLDGLHPERAAALGRLADVLSDLGRNGEAEPLYREQRAVLAAAVGRERPDYERACLSLASALAEEGRPIEAEPLLREALEVVRSRDGPTSEACIPALTRLGWHLAQAERYDEAEPCYREALSIAERAFVRDSPEFSEALDNLGWMIGTAGRYEEAEAIHRATMLLRAATPGCGSEVYCNSFTNLAWVLWRMGRDHEAEAELDTGLAAMRAANVPGDLTFLCALDKVATACRDEGKVEAAREHFRQLRALLADAVGPTDPRTEAAAAALVTLAGDRSDDRPRLQ